MQDQMVNATGSLERQTKLLRKICQPKLSHRLEPCSYGLRGKVELKQSWRISIGYTRTMQYQGGHRKSNSSSNQQHRMTKAQDLPLPYPVAIVDAHEMRTQLCKSVGVWDHLRTSPMQVTGNDWEAYSDLLRANFSADMCIRWWSNCDLDKYHKRRVIYGSEEIVCTLSTQAERTY